MRPSPQHRAFRLIDDPVPPRWSGDHVGLRLTEAFRTLRLIPMPRGVAGFLCPWPAYAYTWEDLLAQQEQGELERTMQLQNRTRLQPSWQEVSRMERAIGWPAEYLRERHLAAAVNHVALAYALDRDCAWVVQRYGGFADTWRDRHAVGCAEIASGLHAARIAVW